MGGEAGRGGRDHEGGQEAWGMAGHHVKSPCLKACIALGAEGG